MPRATHTNRTRRASAARVSALAAALDLVDDGVLLLEANLTIQVANARAAQLLGRPELQGSSLTDLLPLPTAAQLRTSAHAMRTNSATKATLTFVVAGDTGNHLELALHASGQGQALVAILRPLKTSTGGDVIADRDYLTGLPTRATLDARLRAADARARLNRRQYAVLFIDLDDFKRLNDTLGHTSGDRVLTAVAERLQNAVRPGDLVARYGGDEFVIVVDDISTPQLARLDRRLRTTLAAPVDIAGQWVTISASIGRAVGDSSRAAADVLGAADHAMYRAKPGRRRQPPR